MNLPKISVVTITYGHEKYIIETLQGILMQKYSGPVELIISNDNSPDQTDEVIKTYLEEHSVPENFEIKYTRHTINKGMSPNFIWAMNQASGKYIALCEGDDYWTDPLKLQKQVAILEANPEYALCFTRRVLLQDDRLEPGKSFSHKNVFNKSEIPYIPITTLTVLFRNVVNEIPAKMYPTLMDASLFLFLSQFGSFVYIDESTGVYRSHEGGAYGGASALKKHTTSVKARMEAWKYLKHIDRAALADVLIYWLRLKRKAELNNKMYAKARKTKLTQHYFSLYLRYKKVLKN